MMKGCRGLKQSGWLAFDGGGLFLLLVYVVYVYWCCVFICVCVPEEFIRSQESTVIDDFEMPCAYWELNSGPQEVQCY